MSRSNTTFEKRRMELFEKLYVGDAAPNSDSVESLSSEPSSQNLSAPSTAPAPITLTPASPPRGKEKPAAQPPKPVSLLPVPGKSAAQEEDPLAILLAPTPRGTNTRPVHRSPVSLDKIDKPASPRARVERPRSVYGQAMTGRGGSTIVRRPSVEKLSKEITAVSVVVWFDVSRSQGVEVDPSLNKRGLIKLLLGSWWNKEPPPVALDVDHLADTLAVFWSSPDPKDGSEWPAGFESCTALNETQSVSALWHSLFRRDLKTSWVIRAGTPVHNVDTRKAGCLAWASWKLGQPVRGFGEFSDGQLFIQLADKLLGTVNGQTASADGGKAKKKSGGFFGFGAKKTSSSSGKIKVKSKTDRLANITRAVEAFQAHGFVINVDQLLILKLHEEQIMSFIWQIAWQSARADLFAVLRESSSSSSSSSSLSSSSSSSSSSASSSSSLRVSASSSAVTSSSPSSSSSSSPTIDLFTFKCALLQWVHNKSDPKMTTKLVDFGPSFRNGMGIAGLLLGLAPGCVSLDKLGINRVENVAFILRKASGLGIPPILTVAHLDALDEETNILFLIAALQLARSGLPNGQE